MDFEARRQREGALTGNEDIPIGKTSNPVGRWLQVRGKTKTRNPLQAACRGIDHAKPCHRHLSPRAPRL
jgi:hypothetical protein